MNWRVITRRHGPSLGALFGLVYLAATVQAGCIHRLLYYGIPGLQVEDLTSAWQYPDFPDEVEVLQDFIQGGTNIGDQFGSLMEGFLEAPEIGFYTFWMHSDDFGELWLAPDTNPEHVVRIARVPGWSNTGEWQRYRAQKSAPILLVRGEKYFLRVLQKEEGGGDNVGVEWQRPDGTFERPTPTLYVQPYIWTAATLAIARRSPASGDESRQGLHERLSAAAAQLLRGPELAAVAADPQAAMAGGPVQGQAGDHAGGTSANHRRGEEPRTPSALPVVLGVGGEPG